MQCILFAILQILSMMLLAFLYFIDFLGIINIYGIYHSISNHLDKIIGFNLHIHSTPPTDYDAVPVVRKTLSTGRVLIVCNHPTLLDSYAIIRWGLAHGLQHRIVFIAANWIKYLPIPPPFRNKFITIQRDYTVDKDFLTQFSASLPSDAIVVIFPEGTTYDADALSKSIDYRAKEKLPLFSHTVYPRHKGVDLLLQNNTWSQVIDMTLHYPERAQNPFMGSEGHHLTHNIYPRICHLYTEDITHITLHTEKTAKEWLLDRWKLKNKFESALYVSVVYPPLTV